ncbi:hypothetical protein [Azospirillum argentinense]|uniref:hypothetical protein n=1 Tax=Azospirillum argentinense TaxID=2970906 RepID=UPI0015869DB4|nr:hypothetical protein [Azospirillum argentinense]
MTVPLAEMRIRSVGMVPPSMVVRSRSRPGMSSAPGAPSTAERIAAVAMNFAPSEP